MSLATRLASDYPVHLGLWTNWSNGSVRGVTLTLTRDNGGLLIAFIAIFVSIAILRNSGTALDGLQKLTCGLLTWRKNKQHRPCCRLLPFIIAALVNSAAFIVAGIFSSRVSTSTTNEVLINGKHCGQISEEMCIEGGARYYPYFSQRSFANMNYAQRCYTNGSNAEDCHLYVKNSIKSDIKRNASCPFNEEICRIQHENIILDTGYIDSMHDLGINTPPESRSKYRIINHCAPLKLEGFSTIEYVPSSTGDSEQLPIMRYYYGGQSTNLQSYNYTYQYPINSSVLNFRHFSPSTAYADYSIGVHIAYGGNDTVLEELSSFHPIPQLDRLDGDISLFFLSPNAIAFYDQTDDPWFSAHRIGPPLIQRNDSGNNLHQAYYRDYPATVLGCVTQEQFCNPNLPQDSSCEPLRSPIIVYDETFYLWDEGEQRNTMFWLIRNLKQVQENIGNLVAELGVSEITARDGLSDGIQDSLPSDQWQIEVEHWHDTVITSLQGIFVDMVVGPPVPFDECAIRPNNTDEYRMCNNQKIKSALYQSFSVLGLSIIFGIGTIIIITDHTLEPLVGLIQRHYKFSAYSRLEWNVNETLQLQRLAHEELGYGKWSRAGTSNPITQPGEKLAVLNIEDIEHPILQSRDMTNKYEPGQLDSEKPRENIDVQVESPGNASDEEKLLQRFSSSGDDSINTNQASVQYQAGPIKQGEQKSEISEMQSCEEEGSSQQTRTPIMYHLGGTMI